MFSHLVGLICCFSSRSVSISNLSRIFWLKWTHSACAQANTFSCRAPYCTSHLDFQVLLHLAKVIFRHYKTFETHLPCMTYYGNQCLLEISKTPQAIFVVSLPKAWCFCALCMVKTKREQHTRKNFLSVPRLRAVSLFLENCWERKQSVEEWLWSWPWCREPPVARTLTPDPRY